MEGDTHGKDVHGSKEIDSANGQVREVGMVCDGGRVTRGDSGEAEACQLPAGQERFEKLKRHLLGILRRVGISWIQGDMNAVRVQWRTL